ncbi:MBG domain-containing protein, partial [Ruegeria marina]
PYAIVASDAVGSGLENYDITYVDGALTVTPAPLVVTALDQIKFQGEEFVFQGNEISVSGLVVAGDSVNAATLTSPGAPIGALAANSPFAIGVGGATGTGLENYAISYVDGTMVVDLPSDTVPRPPVSVEFGLPNPADDIRVLFAEGETFTGMPGSFGPIRQAALTTLGDVRVISDRLVIAAESCQQGSNDVSRYLACLSDALNSFAAELDEISADLPPGMENVATIIRNARSNVDSARQRAERRLATATTDAEREAIRRDALAEARTALDDAAGEIRKAISLVRVEDPELADIQRATITTVSDALETAGIQLSRVSDL